MSLKSKSTVVAVDSEMLAGILKGSPLVHLHMQVPRPADQVFGSRLYGLISSPQGGLKVTQETSSNVFFAHTFGWDRYDPLDLVFSDIRRLLVWAPTLLQGLVPEKSTLVVFDAPVVLDKNRADILGRVVPLALKPKDESSYVVDENPFMGKFRLTRKGGVEMEEWECDDEKSRELLLVTLGVAFGRLAAQ